MSAISMYELEVLFPQAAQHIKELRRELRTDHEGNKVEGQVIRRLVYAVNETGEEFGQKEGE